MKIEFGLADLNNGIFARYKTEDEAKEAYWEAVSEGCIANKEAIGETGCPWKSEDDCLQAAIPRLVTSAGKIVKRWANQTDSGQNVLAPSPDRWKLRSTTYQGIADAMAAQWGKYNERQ